MHQATVAGPREGVRLRDRLSEHRGAVVAAFAFLVFAANFNAYRVFGDGEVAYTFLRRLFGADVEAVAYQFGLALANAPFYAAGKAASAAGLSDFQDAPVLPATISLASNFYVVAAMLAIAAVIAAMRLPRPGFVVLAAVFGTPLWYYGSFSPSYSHAADAFLVTAAAGVLFLYYRRPAPEKAAAVGAILGLAATVRWLNVVLAAGLALAFLLQRRRRDAVLSAGVAAAVFGGLLLVPLAVGAPIFARHYRVDILGFAPLSPLKMLFTPHRGLFVWTPLTLLAVVGYVRLFRVRPDFRPYLATLGAMAVGLVLAQAAIPFWHAGWSFSQRYFTALFPVFALGLAGLATWRPRVTAAGAALAVAWSLFIGLNHVFGVSQEDGAFEIAGYMVGGERSVGEFLDMLWAYCRLKYAVP